MHSTRNRAGERKLVSGVRIPFSPPRTQCMPPVLDEGHFFYPFWQNALATCKKIWYKITAQRHGEMAELVESARLEVV